MKRVVRYNLQTVSISQINDKSIVGVTLGENTTKYGVLRDVLSGSGGQVCFRPIGIELDSTDFGIYFFSKKDLCKDFLKTGGEVFLFDTEKDLFKWMIKKNKLKK